ncbi:MAG: heparinase II/III family protein [Lentisphaeria bacterium]|nr:heparinase II/III family protein [Lentisphaeria bacterium]
MTRTMHLTVVSVVMTCMLHAADDRKEEFVRAVVGGAGYMPWQERGTSPEEMPFRREMEKRKDRMLAERASVRHPVLLTEAELSQAKRNIESAAWAKDWLARHRRIADHIVAQPDGYIDAMIPELTPWLCYGMTCPNCVGKKSQEAMGRRVMGWRHTNPDVLRCRACGQEYPDAGFPETAKLTCPRSGQELTFYLNEAERAHPEDRSGKHAWHWVGRPTHVSFAGMIRYQKVTFMTSAVRSLALVHRFTDDPRYAEKAVAILKRLAHCYRNWLYHDYWDTVADCDPLYAAWHDRALPLVWKRHLCTDAYKKDTVDRAAMLQSFWGAGRVHPSCDVTGKLVGLSLAYDLVHDACDGSGRPLWTPETRAKVERDLFMEWLMGGEPFLGGAGKATNVNNKSGRVYKPMAYVAKCLGITQWADTALSGFEALATQSLTYDGFSHESAAYTFSGASYFGNMLGLAEALHGFRWPEGYTGRTGVVDLYRDCARFRLLMRAQIDCLRPDGLFPPLSDTPIGFRPSATYLEIGMKRLPEYYAGALGSFYPRSTPSEYAVLHLDTEPSREPPPAGQELALPEIYFPAWMTGVMRHGTGSDAAMLTLHASPPGGHRHSDSLSLFYMSGGGVALGDHGYIGDTPMNSWFKHTFSHNLVVVDGQKQRHRKPPRIPRLHLMATSPRVSVIEASSEVYEQCSEYRRLIALIKGPGAGTFVVDVFRVSGGNRHAFRVFSERAASDAKDGALVFEKVVLPPEPPLPEIGASLRREDIFGLRDVRSTEDVPATWQATWKQAGAAYRLWMLADIDEVAASNGPGQETRRQVGRRVRYVDAIRKGENLASTFVAIHEPSRADGEMIIQAAERLVVPEQAGPRAVALRVASKWGAIWILVAFDNEIEIDGIRFQGEFGVFCERSESSYWLMGAAARTLERAGSGYADLPAIWRGKATENTSSIIRADTPRPTPWPEQLAGCSSTIRLHDGTHHTGFPVDATTSDTITVTRFPLPEVSEFELPAVRYISVEKTR